MAHNHDPVVLNPRGHPVPNAPRSRNFLPEVVPAADPLPYPFIVVLKLHVGAVLATAGVFIAARVTTVAGSSAWRSASGAFQTARYPPIPNGAPLPTVTLVRRRRWEIMRRPWMAATACSETFCDAIGRVCCQGSSEASAFSDLWSPQRVYKRRL
jgi:hypothetical protein